MEEGILIDGLELDSRVGVTAKERGSAQRLTANLRLVPARPLENLHDDLHNTIDYAVVCELARSHASAGSRQLIETLAEDLALMLLARFPLRAVEIELRKYVVPGTQFVAVRLRREAAHE